MTAEQVTQDINETTPSKKEERMQNAASKKKGRNITLMTKDEDGTITILAGENEGLRTRKDVKDWMNEHKYIGKVYPVRIDEPLIRSEQTVIKVVG